MLSTSTTSKTQQEVISALNKFQQDKSKSFSMAKISQKQIPSKLAGKRNVFYSSDDENQQNTVNYHLDLGLCLSGLDNQIQNKTFIFNNCNVTINNVHDSCDLKSFHTADKIVQTDDL